MASSFQLLLRGLDGRTSCLRFPSPIITGSLIQEQISATLRLPTDAVLIFTGTALVHHQTSLSADADGFFPSCSLSSRLRGGKGGFGSLLRGAATKAGQKKTSNFDACRDMSGRRLRHVNAEKKLKEWKAQAKERELEKAASEFLKKQVKRQEDDSGCYQLIEKFREQTSKAREDVESAVTSGLAEARNFGKRKVVEDDLPSASSSKRAHTWCESTLDVIDDDDDDLEDATDESDDDHDDDTEKVFDIDVVKECLVSSEAVEVLEAKGNLKNSMVEGSKMEEGNTSSENGKPQELIKCANIELQIDNKNSEILSEEKRTENVVEEKLQEDLGYGELSVHAEKTVQTLESVDNDPSSPRELNIHCDAEQCNSEEVQKECKTINVPRDTENHPMSVPKSVEQMQETLKLDHFSHASDLEILGLDRLKFELQMRGLKCGGSLSERAGRLFLLKTIPLQNLDKKHFAKARG